MVEISDRAVNALKEIAGRVDSPKALGVIGSLMARTSFYDTSRNRQKDALADANLLVKLGYLHDHLRSKDGGDPFFRIEMEKLYS